MNKLKKEIKDIEKKIAEYSDINNYFELKKSLTQAKDSLTCIELANDCEIKALEKRKKLNKK